MTMKKYIVWLLWLFSLLSFGAVFAQSLPTIGGAMTTTVISQPYQQSQCIEPDGSIVYINRQFYLWDTYTTTDTAPRWGNGYDTLLLSASKVFIYNAALFNFTSPINYKSNGIPSTAPVNAMVVAQGTFVVNSTSPWQLVYNIHRTALENKWSTSYSLTYLGRPNLTNYTATLTNKTFHNQAWRVVNGYECVNYTVHYCGDGVVDTQQSIANLPGWFASSIANEQCDGTAWVPAGYTCTSACTLQAVVVKPTCTLAVSSGSITLGTSVQTLWTINGNYTNTPQITYTPTTRNILWLPYTVTTANGQQTITPQHIWTYILSMTVSNSAWSTICTAPLQVNQPQILQCTLTASPNPVLVNQTAAVTWNVTGGTFVWTYINVNPLVGWWPHWVNTNEYTGTTYVVPTQTGDYTFSMLVNNMQSTVLCTWILHVIAPWVPKLSLTKTLINDILYHSGDLVSFRIDFANISTVTANNAVLTDYLPAWLEYVSSQLYGVPVYVFGTWNNGVNQSVEYSWFNLVPGQVGYMIITGKFKWYQYAQYTLNNVYLQTSNTPQLYAAAFFHVYTPSANATITKTVNKTSFYPGENANFTIAVTNNGPDAINNVQLIDTWPTNNNWCVTADATRTSNTPMTMTNANNPYTWNLNGSLAVGQTVYLYLTGHIGNNQSCVGNYINNIDLRYMVNGQLKTWHADVSINVSTLPTASMIIEKKIVSYGNLPWDPVVFELIYTNNGTATLSNYDIVDYRPGTLNFISASPMPTTQTVNSGWLLLHWYFTTPITPNGTGKITINWTIK